MWCVVCRGGCMFLYVYCCLIFGALERPDGGCITLFCLSLYISLPPSLSLSFTLTHIYTYTHSIRPPLFRCVSLSPGHLSERRQPLRGEMGQTVPPRPPSHIPCVSSNTTATTTATAITRVRGYRSPSRPWGRAGHCRRGRRRFTGPLSGIGNGAGSLLTS